MQTIPHRSSIGLVMTGVLAALALGPATGDQHDTRATMGAIFDDIRTVLPWSVSAGPVTDPEARARIQRALTDIAGRALEVEVHASETDVGTHYLASALRGAAIGALQSFDGGRVDNAKFEIRNMTQLCIACHTRLPEPRDAPLAKHFIDERVFADLGLEEKARIELATRQFDRARSSFEALLASEDTPAPELLDALVDYLVVNVRVRGDFRRPRPVLLRFSERADVWTALAEDVRDWIVALTEYEESGVPAPSIAAARELLERARQWAIVPYSRQPMIHYIVASRVLNQYIKLHPEPGPERSEAYYLLGLTQYGIGQSAWLGEAEDYLRNAVIADPGSEFAGRAFALLEEQIIFGYTGSAGTHLPAEVERELEELRRLLPVPGG